MNKNNSIWLVLTIALLTMVGPFTIDTYLPSFPSIEAEFHINRVLLLQSISFYLIASAISTLLWGPLSDRIGRRNVILGTLVLYLVASLGCAFATEYLVFLMFRVFQGIAASGGMVAGRAMVRDAHDSHDAHRIMAYIMMLFATAPAIAPIIGGWLHDIFGWRSVFYFLTIYGGVMLLMSGYLLPETLEITKRQSFHPLAVTRVYGRTLLHSRFLTLVLAVGSSFAGLFIYIAGSPTVIFSFLGLDTNDFLVLFVPMTTGIIVGSFISGKLAHRWSTQGIINIAFVLMVLASLLNIMQAVWLAPSAITLIAPLVLYALGIALALPGFGILAIDCFPDNKGAASAVQSFVQVIIAALVSSLMLPLISDNILDFAMGQSACLFLGLLFWCSHGCNYND